jgi:hypothetical protein
MNSNWKANSDLDPDKLESQLKAHQPTLEILARIIEKKRNLIPSPRNYESPSWPYLRADLDGYNRALTEVLQLIQET